MINLRKLAGVVLAAAIVLPFAGCANMMDNGTGAKNTCRQPVYTKYSKGPMMGHHRYYAK